MDSIHTFIMPLCWPSCHSRNILCMWREILEKLLFKKLDPKMPTEIRCQSRIYPTSLLTIFLLPTHCTFEKFIHIAYLSVCFISQTSTQSTRDSFFASSPKKPFTSTFHADKQSKIFILQTAILIYFKRKTFCNRTLMTLSWSSYYLVIFA